MNGTQELFAVMVEGKQAPAKLYIDYKMAEAEAKRLAIKERQTAYVMKAVSKLELNEVKITKL